MGLTILIYFVDTGVNKDDKQYNVEFLWFLILWYVIIYVLYLLSHINAYRYQTTNGQLLSKYLKYRNFHDMIPFQRWYILLRKWLFGEKLCTTRRSATNSTSPRLSNTRRSATNSTSPRLSNTRRWATNSTSSRLSTTTNRTSR